MTFLRVSVRPQQPPIILDRSALVAGDHGAPQHLGWKILAVVDEARMDHIGWPQLRSIGDQK
jgi:hypothetical protein